jgi:hypothetical protein
VNIDNVRLNPFSPCSVEIRWDVVNPSGGFTYFVERSESPEGPWDNLTPTGIGEAYGYIDRGLNREALDRNVYYRIRAINPVTGEEVISMIASSVEKAGTPIGTFIAMQERRLLERFIGIDSMVYIKRTFGQKCTSCFDPVRGKSIKSGCPICFDTTFKNGYFLPIKMMINFSPRQKARDLNPLQYTENTNVTAWAGNYPILSPGDLIIEVERNSDRYVIQGISNTENGGAIVHQNLSLNKLLIAAPQYKIFQPLDVRNINDVNVYRQEWV